MNLKHQIHRDCDQELGICGVTDSREPMPVKKPIEIYTFIDPLCSECWAIEPILKKLQVEYGHYFKIRVLLSGKLSVWNACELHTSKSKKVWLERFKSSTMACAGDVEFSNMDLHPYKAFLAIKAAELQGPKAGNRFLRKMRESLFLKKKNVTDEETLKECAQEADLDLEAFISDLHSPSASKALQCDVQTTSEMDVDAVPTFVYFNGNSEDAGIKVSGQYPYHIYVQLLEDMLGYKPKKAIQPELESFLKHYGFLATAEVATVLDISDEEAEKQLKSLMLQQKVEAVPFKYGTFWKWIS